MLKISVVIPTFNAADTLERAVESCLQQNFTGYEIIIVDNNSTDETLRVARALADAHDVISVLQERKQGAAAARNTGARAARGEWLQFLDADDVLLGGKWERQMSLVDRRTEWIIGAYLDREVRYGLEDRIISVDDDPWRAILLNGRIGSTNSNLFIRSLYEELGGMDDELINHEDYDFYFKILKARKVWRTDAVPSAIYIHEGSASLSQHDPVGSAHRRVCLTERIIEELKQHHYTYFAANVPMVRSALLKHLRLQATVDYPSAIANEFRLVNVSYRRKHYGRSTSVLLLLMYRFLGFARLERLRLTGADLLPNWSKDWLKG